MRNGELESTTLKTHFESVKMRGIDPCIVEDRAGLGGTPSATWPRHVDILPSLAPPPDSAPNPRVTGKTGRTQLVLI